MEKPKHQVNLSLQIVPINSSNSYAIIDSAIHSIQESGIKHEVLPFSSIMEGKLEEVIQIMLTAKDAALNSGADELLMNVQIHLKKDGDVTFEEKTEKFKS